MTNTASHNSEQKPYWYVVADESKAVIYEARARYGRLQQRAALENQSAREKMDELIADRGGRSYDSFGEGRHTLQKEKTDPKKHAAISFAREIIRQIAVATKQGTCREYALIAAPRFLGLLRDELQTSTLGEPFLTINKDMVAKPADEIEKLVAR